MKVNYYEEPQAQADHIDVYYRQMNEEIQGIKDFFDADNSIVGRQDGIYRQMKPEEIYYCEIVDRKCYAYLKDEVYQIELSIQSLLEQFHTNGFVRIGKSMVANIYKVKSLKMDLNMKVQVYLKNGEILLLNRGYKKEFMEYLRSKADMGGKKGQK